MNYLYFSLSVSATIVDEIDHAVSTVTSFFCTIVFILLAVGIILFIINRINKSQKAKMAEEERNRLEYEQEMERRYQEAVQRENSELSEWKEKKVKSVINSFDSIDAIVSFDDDGCIQYTQPFYDVKNANNCKIQLDQLKAEAAEKDKTARHVSYVQALNSELDSHINTLHKGIQTVINDFRNWKFDYRLALPSFLCQLAYVTGDYQYVSTANAAYKFVFASFDVVTKIDLNNYGNIITPVDTDEKMMLLSGKVIDLETKIITSISRLDTSSDKHYESVVQNLYPEMISDAEKLMWYYAKKKPFDTEKFEVACRIYGSFARKIDDGAYDSIEMIARTYAKQAIGGETTVDSDREMINKWVASSAARGNNFEGQALASALAWMDLYNIELNVLKQLVNLKVQLHESVQERLRFLSDGSTLNIKIYDVSDPETLLFDSSSESWNEKEISTCFRNFKMKKLLPHYSLVISNWKKSIPLPSGQKLSAELLNESFEEMVKDFDNEVRMKQTDAKAVNLSNLIYPNAVVFSFLSERNRCVDVLFHCEKFGRNINITILTLFTPSDDITLEEMEKYAIAIKSNTLIESFRESILQVFDKAIKEDVVIFDNNFTSDSNSIFE